ncbi:protein of unknown function [Moritella yayanosii]|uniref:Uncharacterized protein n=1 Tax=Moritella yayanosii TaxID=69539 RepID=A0A330LLE3_9GAMM|nr:protein of unknown function [Moritella yayanosii]
MAFLHPQHLDAQGFLDPVLILICFALPLKSLPKQAQLKHALTKFEVMFFPYIL